MLVGIDVGGTFTDGVVCAGGKILDSAKHPTEEGDLQGSIFAVLDDLLQGVKKDDLANKIIQVVLSTTLVTNLLAAGGGEQVALIMIPGPGLNLKQLDFFPHTYIISGAVDFRGKIIEPLKQTQVEEIGTLITAAGIKKVAVVGKFSQRNNSHERLVEEILKNRHPHLEIVRGFEVSGQLNFLRRAVTAYYTAVTRDKWARFADSIKKALRKRGIVSPINILKADGGTMPLEVSLHNPCETVFSGPAASVMGAFALTMDQQTSVVVDIGGTTTDLALILEGRPLYASRGAVLSGRYTHVRSFAVRSMALGGDSTLRWTGNKISVGPDRLGPAACFGGPAATPTDAVNILEKGKLGSLSLSHRALEEISKQAGLKVEKLAREVVRRVNDRLKDGIDDMFRSWEQEPAYKIWEIVNKRQVRPDRIVGIGAAAGAFIPALAERFGCQALVHRYSPVANALGAAVARPTLSLLLHADTQRQSYYLNLEGITGKFSSDGQLADAKDLAQKKLQEIAEKRGIGKYADHREIFLEEQFNMIRGWSTTGKLFDVGVQIASGIIDEFKGVQP
ncbi:MAG: hydantoinase/oxoprolinase family protein [Firmicutes bacterium]|nr:hydantoinase/oxoprolinase family protein [Bacillota bacterium]